jgi:hypothetical protein
VAVTSSIDEELNQFERDIRQLKIEYDQFFGGGRKRPPTEIEWRLEQIAKRYSERSGELKFGQRFRYNNLTQTYAKYKDIFRKKLAQREEGKVTRHFGAAAKEIEAERAKKRENAREVEAAAKAAAPFAREPGVERPAAAASAPEAPGAFRVVCSQPEAETEKVAELYAAFRNAKQSAGESTERLTQAGFTEFVLKKTKSLQKEKNCRDVEYVVEMVEGQVKLKALVKG